MLRHIPALSLAVCLCASVAHAQSVTYSVVAPFPGDATVGGAPDSQLVQYYTGDLYGSTSVGGAANRGSQYRATLSGSLTGIKELCNSGRPGNCEVTTSFTIDPGGDFIGTTEMGGEQPTGTLYYTRTDGYQNDLALFLDENVGIYPSGVLTLGTDGDYYGETLAGGTKFGNGSDCLEDQDGDASGCGAIFRYTGSGTLQNVYSFGDGTDGLEPSGGLLQGRDGNYYGVATRTFFKVSADGTFTAYTNNTDTTDTAYVGPPVEDAAGNFYFAATSSSGLSSGGAILKVATDGTISQLHQFCSLATCLDGSEPGAPLLLPNGNLIGYTTAGGNPDCSGTGGVSGCGTIFELTPAGTLTTLYSFDSTNANGYTPSSTPLTGMDGNLYGVTKMGGSCADCGVLYKLVHSPALLPAVQVSLSSSKVAANAAATLNFTVNQATSDTLQQCYGYDTGAGAGTFTGLQTGTYNATTAVYSGSVKVTPVDAGVYTYGLTCGGTVSGAANLTVTTGTVTALSATPNPASIGKSVTATAAVTRSIGSGVATGSVTFSVGGVVLGTAALNSSGIATLTASTAGQQPGTYPLVASYGGDASDTASSATTSVVLQSYGTTTTIGDTPTSVTPPASIKFTAKVTANNSVPVVPTGSVTFTSEGRTLATVPLNDGVATYSASSSGVPPGTYPVVATYNPSSTMYTKSQSAPVNATVK